MIIGNIIHRTDGKVALRTLRATFVCKLFDKQDLCSKNFQILWSLICLKASMSSSTFDASAVGSRGKWEASSNSYSSLMSQPLTTCESSGAMSAPRKTATPNLCPNLFQQIVSNMWLKPWHLQNWMCVNFSHELFNWTLQPVGGSSKISRSLGWNLTCWFPIVSIEILPILYVEGVLSGSRGPKILTQRSMDRGCPHQNVQRFQLKRS